MVLVSTVVCVRVGEEWLITRGRSSISELEINSPLEIAKEMQDCLPVGDTRIGGEASKDTNSIGRRCQGESWWRGS